VPGKEPARVEIGGESDVKSRAGSDHGSPRRGSGCQISLAELEEGTGASISPKVASAMAVGDGRSSKAATAAMQVARGARGGERGASEG
jgi:hypothetical protein